MFRRSSPVLQRKALRAKIRDLETRTRWPNKRKAAKLARLRRQYEKLGVEVFSSIPFSGLDTTDKLILDDEGNQVSIHDLGPYLGENSPANLLKAELATRPVYRDGTRFEETLEPGQEVDPGDYEEIEDY